MDKAREEMQLMSKMLLESERRFLQFNEIVPYADNSDDVFSPRLVDLLQNIGAQIDGTFKILISISDLNPEQEKFPFFYKELNKKGMLTVQELILKESGRLIKPFVFDASLPAPMWWSAYNDVKHELPKGAYSGRYGNVINALAALMILHELAAFALISRGLTSQILEGKNWHNLVDSWNLRDKPANERKKSLEPDFWREQGGHVSEIFYSPMLWSSRD